MEIPCLEANLPLLLASPLLLVQAKALGTDTLELPSSCPA